VSRQLGETTKVLSDCSKRTLELRTGRTRQSQAAEPQNALKVDKQHLDLLAIPPGLLVRSSLGDRAGDIARRLVLVARDLPAR
jgi:hypothetical protein